MSKEERALIADFYEERKKADYTLGEIDKNLVQDYIKLVRKLLKVIVE